MKIKAIPRKGPGFSLSGNISYENTRRTALNQIKRVAGSERKRSYPAASPVSRSGRAQRGEIPGKWSVGEKGKESGEGRESACLLVADGVTERRKVHVIPCRDLDYINYMQNPQISEFNIKRGT